MGIWREHSLRMVAVALEEKPGPAADERPARAAAARKDLEPLGVSLDEQPGLAGLRITSVDLRSAAYLAGLREGDIVVDVDGRPVRDRAGFRKAVADSGAVTRLYVKRSGRSIFFGVRKDLDRTIRAGSP